MKPNTEERLLISQKQVRAMLGFSHEKWSELVALGLAPKPVRLPGLARYSRADVVKWLEKLPREG